MPTPMRTYRAEPGLYEAAVACAKYNDETVAQVIRRALVSYVAETHKKQRAKAAAARRRSVR